MSAATSLITDPDEVQIEVGDYRFGGWQAVTITRSCESIPNSFALSASTEFMQGPALAGTRPGQSCKIYIGADLVITGWIDRRSISADAHGHLVTLTGRGITRNLVDCSADIQNDPGLKGGMVNGTSTFDLAQKLTKAYGVTVKTAVKDLGLAIKTFQIRLGETPYEIIESVAAYAGYLVYEDTAGALVLDRVGTQTMASGFTMPGNIEAISADRSVDQRYSDYVVAWYGVDQLQELNATANQRAIVKDPTLGEYRLKITVSPQITPEYDFGLAFAKWEMARRIGRSQAAQITCDSWRDNPINGAVGKLWTPNWLARIEAPLADISGATWIIGTVTYRKDLSGTHTDLVLMPPDAFNPKPNPLNLFDRELSQSPNAAQDPAPPSTRSQTNDAPGF